jgi:hypothetical protein
VWKALSVLVGAAAIAAELPAFACICFWRPLKRSGEMSRAAVQPTVLPVLSRRCTARRLASVAGS